MKSPVIAMALALGVALGLFSSARGATITDNFDTPHNYLGGNVTGTIWSGVLFPSNLRVGNASTSNAGLLTWAANPYAGWEPGGYQNGPVLYRTVPDSNFDVSVYVSGMSSVPWSDGGLMIRNPLNNSFIYSRHFGTAGFMFDAVAASNGYNLNLPHFNSWLRIVRNGAQFDFYSRPNALAPWSLDTSYNFPPANTGTPLQVGLWFGTFGTGNLGEIRFDNFSLSAPSIVVPEPASWALAACGALTLAMAARRRGS